MNNIKLFKKGDYVKTKKGFIGEISRIYDDGTYQIYEVSGGISYKDEDLILSSKEDYLQRKQDREELFEVLYFSQSEIIEMSQAEYERVMHIIKKNSNYMENVYRAYRTNDENVIKLAKIYKKWFDIAAEEYSGGFVGDQYAGLDFESLVKKAKTELEIALSA